jgi:hypothetical protein
LSIKYFILIIIIIILFVFQKKLLLLNYYKERININFFWYLKVKNFYLSKLSSNDPIYAGGTATGTVGGATIGGYAIP